MAHGTQGRETAPSKGLLLRWPPPAWPLDSPGQPRKRLRLAPWAQEWERCQGRGWASNEDLFLTRLYPPICAFRKTAYLNTLEAQPGHLF